LTGADLHRTSIVIANRAELPPYCISCGTTTDRYVFISENVTIDGDPWIARLYYLDSQFGTLPIEEPGEKHHLEIKIPQCKKCAHEGKPKPGHVDWDAKEMTFIASKVFNEEMHLFGDK
jgi:hypothetical protein